MGIACGSNTNLEEIIDMPRRHGLFRSEGKTPVCLMGILQIFDALANGPFRVGIRKQKYLDNRGIIDKIKDPIVQIDFHFRKVLLRLLYSLDVFQRRFIVYGEYLNTWDSKVIDPFVGNNLSCETGIAADSILTYLNMFIDDIARVIFFVMSEEPPEKLQNDISSFGELKGKILEKSAFPICRPLFNELNKKESWWFLGFKREEGMRQRIVHYTDLIQFQGSKDPADEKVHPQAVLFGIGRPDRSVDFENELRKALHGLCEWLDRLEQILLDELRKKATKEKLNWNAAHECRRIYVPVEHNTIFREIPETDFLYLPICDNSASLKCKVRYGFGDDP